MTRKELQERLDEFPEDMEVVIGDFLDSIEDIDVGTIEDDYGNEMILIG